MAYSLQANYDINKGLQTNVHNGLQPTSQQWRQ